MLLTFKNNPTPSPSPAQAEALVQALHSLADHLLQDIFGHPLFEPVAMPDSVVHLAPANQLKSNLLRISLLKRKIRAGAESISLDATPEEILHASTSIAQAITELSGVALRRIESQQQELKQKVDSLTALATVASPPAPEAKRTVETPPAPGPAASAPPQPTALKPVAPHPETAAFPSKPTARPLASPAPLPGIEATAPRPEPAPDSSAKRIPVAPTAEIQPRSLFPFALNEARSTSGCFLAVLPIERFSMYQSRFGAQVAKEIFDYFAQYLRRCLHPTDQIFCWADGVVLAIIFRTVSIDSVRAELMRLGLQKVEQTVPLGGGRFFNLCMSSNVAVLGVEKSATNEQVINKIDNLVVVSAKSR